MKIKEYLLLHKQDNASPQQNLNMMYLNHPLRRLTLSRKQSQSQRESQNQSQSQSHREKLNEREGRGAIRKMGLFQNQRLSEGGRGLDYGRNVDYGSYGNYIAGALPSNRKESSRKLENQSMENFNVHGKVRNPRNGNGNAKDYGYGDGNQNGNECASVASGARKYANVGLRGMREHLRNSRNTHLYMKQAYTFKTTIDKNKIKNLQDMRSSFFF